MDGVIGICIFSFVFSLISAWVNRKFGNRKRTKEIQKQINDFQKELKEAQAKKDEKKIKKLEAQQKDMLKLAQEMMFLPFKSMIIILPLFFVALYLINMFFPGVVITLPFSLPVPKLPEIIAWRNVFGSRGTFILFTVVFGLVIEGFITLYEKLKNK